MNSAELQRILNRLDNVVNVLSKSGSDTPFKGNQKPVVKDPTVIAFVSSIQTEPNVSDVFQEKGENPVFIPVTDAPVSEEEEYERGHTELVLANVKTTNDVTEEAPLSSTESKIKEIIDRVSGGKTTEEVEDTPSVVEESDQDVDTVQKTLNDVSHVEKKSSSKDGMNYIDNSIHISDSTVHVSGNSVQAAIDPKITVKGNTVGSIGEKNTNIYEPIIGDLVKKRVLVSNPVFTYVGGKGISSRDEDDSSRSISDKEDEQIEYDDEEEEEGNGNDDGYVEGVKQQQESEEKSDEQNVPPEPEQPPPTVVQERRKTAYSLQHGGVFFEGKKVMSQLRSCANNTGVNQMVRKIVRKCPARIMMAPRGHVSSAGEFALESYSNISWTSVRNVILLCPFVGMDQADQDKCDNKPIIIPTFERVRYKCIDPDSGADTMLRSNVHKKWVDELTEKFPHLCTCAGKSVYKNDCKDNGSWELQMLYLWYYKCRAKVLPILYNDDMFCKMSLDQRMKMLSEWIEWLTEKLSSGDGSTLLIFACDLTSCCTPISTTGDPSKMYGDLGEEIFLTIHDNNEQQQQRDISTTAPVPKELPKDLTKRIYLLNKTIRDCEQRILNCLYRNLIEDLEEEHKKRSGAWFKCIHGLQLICCIADWLKRKDDSFKYTILITAYSNFFFIEPFHFNTYMGFTLNDYPCEMFEGDRSVSSDVKKVVESSQDHPPKAKLSVSISEGVGGEPEEGSGVVDKIIQKTVQQISDDPRQMDLWQECQWNLSNVPYVVCLFMKKLLSRVKDIKRISTIDYSGTFKLWVYIRHLARSSFPYKSIPKCGVEVSYYRSERLGGSYTLDSRELENLSRESVMIQRSRDSPSWTLLDMIGITTLRAIFLNTTNISQESAESGFFLRDVSNFGLICPDVPFSDTAANEDDRCSVNPFYFIITIECKKYLIHLDRTRPLGPSELDALVSEKILTFHPTDKKKFGKKHKKK